MKRQADWRIRQALGCLEIMEGGKVVARCYSRHNALLIVSSPTMLRALLKTERALLRSNRQRDGSQLQNTDAAKLLAEVIAPALDAARGKTKGATPSKRRPLTGRASLPV